MKGKIEYRIKKIISKMILIPLSFWVLYKIEKQEKFRRKIIEAKDNITEEKWW